MQTSPDLLRIAILKAGLCAPNLTRTARRAGIREIANHYGISETTVERQLKRTAAGEEARKTRSDRGGSRAFGDGILAAFHQMCIDPGLQNANVTDLQERLVQMFPDSRIAYSTLCEQRKKFMESIPVVAPTPRQIEVGAVNDRWEMDLSIMDCFIADPAINDGMPFRPQLIVCLDSRSRCCMYAMYCRHGDKVNVGQTLYNAIIPQSASWPQCGLPKEVGCDWGKVFTSVHFSTVCRNLGIDVNLGHPYYPLDKAKVERFIGTIHNTFENTLPGWCSNDNKGESSIDPRKDFRLENGVWIDPRCDKPLMTLAEANHLLWNWIFGTYHADTHATLKCSPMVAWLRETRGIPMQLPDLKFMEMTILEQEPRKVRRGTVQLWGLRYWHEALVGCEGLQVTVHFTRDDVTRVYVYHGHVRICEAKPLEAFIVGQDMDWARWHAIRRANRNQQAVRDAVLDEIAASELPIPDDARLINERAAVAPIPFVAPPTHSSRLASESGLTDEDLLDMSRYEFGGMPWVDEDDLPAAAAQ